jgi:transposase-like protein
MSMTKINSKTRVSAVKDYVTSGDPLRVVSERHGISSETLRRFLGNKIRKNKRGRPVTKGVTKGVMSIPFPTVRKRSGKDETRPNANRRWSSAEDELLRDAVLGNFTVEEIVDTNKTAKSQFILGQHNGKDVILRKGKFGLYISWGENSKTLKELGNRPIENVTFDEDENNYKISKEFLFKLLRVRNKSTLYISEGPNNTTIIKGGY